MPVVDRCPTCAGQVIKPDPGPPLTREEMAAFAREWDRRFEEGQRRDGR